MYQRVCCDHFGLNGTERLLNLTDYIGKSYIAGTYLMLLYRLEKEWCGESLHRESVLSLHMPSKSTPMLIISLSFYGFIPL